MLYVFLRQFHVICYPQPNRTKTKIVSLFKGTKVPALLVLKVRHFPILCEQFAGIYNKTRKCKKIKKERTGKRNIYDKRYYS